MVFQPSGFRGVTANLAIATSGVLDRKMPESFIDAVFGDAKTTQRVALNKLIATLDPRVQSDPKPVDGGLLLVAGTCVGIARPTPGGLLFAMSSTAKSKSQKIRRTQIYQIFAHTDLPGALESALAET